MPSKCFRVMFAILGILAVSTTSLSLAQDDDHQASDQERVLDTVEVTDIQDDPAMAAFRAGDFETAETEFLANAMCALRRERNRLASIDTARTSAARAEIFSNATGGDSGVSSRGANAGSGPVPSTGLAVRDGIAPQNLNDRNTRSCEDRGRQLYFAGLSQIQLGKTDEALANFESATADSKILYDAHYKIALINILQGDLQNAEKQLRHIERILDRCGDCEARQEIIERRDHLSRALNGEVQLR